MYPNPNEIKKILIRPPNWVGDIVMATPAFRCIRESYPHARISILLRPHVRKILEGAPWFDELIEYSPKAGFKPGVGSQKDSYKAGIGCLESTPLLSPPSQGGDRGGVELKTSDSILKTIRLLRSKRFDLGIVFPNSFSSALMMFVSGARRRVGYKRDARSWLLTDGIDRLRENGLTSFEKEVSKKTLRYPGEAHFLKYLKSFWPTFFQKGRFQPTYMADFYLRLCTYIGCQPQSRELELFVSDNDFRRVDELFIKHRIATNKPVFLINPGASYGSSKCWNAEGFATVADLLKAHYDCNILVVCGPEEVELGNKIRCAAKKEVINLTHEEVPLDVLKALVKRCSLLITVDSGPRHYAVAFKKPVVVLMGPTDPRYTETRYEIGHVIRREDVPCSPCHLKTCPTDHHCMEQITPEVVFSACKELIN